MLQIALVFQHSCAVGIIMDKFATGSWKNWYARIIQYSCLLVFVCDCNPRVQLPHICMHV